MSFLGLPLRHIPPLFIGTSITVMCTPAYVNTPYAIRLYGLPDHIANSPIAHSPFVLYTSRIQALGMLILAFYAKGEYAAVDTVMSVFGFIGAVDVYICLKEGVPGTAVFRGISSALVGLWGLSGMTAR